MSDWGDLREKSHEVLKSNRSIMPPPPPMGLGLTAGDLREKSHEV